MPWDSCRVIPVSIPNTEVKSATLIILGWRRPGKVSTARVNYIKEPRFYIEALLQRRVVKSLISRLV